MGADRDERVNVVGRSGPVYDAVGMCCGFEQGGDGFANLRQLRERPIVIDLARPPTPPVFPLRADLDEDGHPLETIADWIVALRDDSSTPVAASRGCCPVPTAAAGRGSACTCATSSTPTRPASSSTRFNHFSLFSPRFS